VKAPAGTTHQATSSGWPPPDPGLIAAAETVFSAQGWQVFRTADLAVAREYVAGLAASGGTVAVHDCRAWERIGAEETLGAHGLRVVHFGPGATAGDRRSLLGADVGVTGAVALVAESGTALLAADDASAQLVSNLPYTHVVLASPFKLVPDLASGMRLVRLYAERALGRDVPRFVGAVSGPSRTGDIEMIIVQGMHGPGRVHLVLLDLEPRQDMLGDLPADLLCP
jgi:L-lactate utilization protein LutC